jgi:hypothetical protein
MSKQQGECLQEVQNSPAHEPQLAIVVDANTPQLVRLVPAQPTQSAPFNSAIGLFLFEPAAIGVGGVRHA